MRMILSGKLIVRCDCCGRKINIDIESLEEDSFAYERNMGDEIEYDFSGEHICEECRNQLSYCIKAFEYPVGALNYSDSECHGCKLIESPIPVIEYDEADIDSREENVGISMLDTILEKCDARYKGRSCVQCSDCSYGEHCPHSCEKCLDYIHTPTHAPSGAPDRKYDCVHMADFYTCKYSCRYASEIMYALEQCRDLRNAEKLKVLSFGCGPCTDLFAIDSLKGKGVLNYNCIEYSGVDYSKGVWKYVHSDIQSFQGPNCRIKFYYEDACELICQIAEKAWTPNLIVFQYVFSDMRKHSELDKIQKFIDVFSEFFIKKVEKNSYIILNDINLGCCYGGGRDYFDELLKKLNGVLYDKGHFHNDNGKGYYADGYPYGREFPDNRNRFELRLWRDYSPFNTCASAQLMIKKVKG